MSVVSYRNVLTRTEPEKSLTRGFKRGVGRNSAGRITVRHKGGGVKRSYRDIDFKYDKIDIPAMVKSVEYDPNRSGFISLLFYADGAKRYVLLPAGLKVGDKVITSEKADIKPGNRLPLKKIPVGTFLYNIEILPRSGAKMIRSAGNYAELLAHDGGYALLKMPSSEIRKVSLEAWASVGQVSNEEYKLRNFGKAGRSRWLGIRPTVRGSAMNPVDHPLGGGEGRQPRGMSRVKKYVGQRNKGSKNQNAEEIFQCIHSFQKKKEIKK